MAQDEKLEITDVEQMVYIDDNKRLVNGYEITFTVNAGKGHTVKVPQTGYTSEIGKKAVQDEWNKIKETLDLDF